jgi:predicted SAM-dependent methyltransferase
VNLANHRRLHIGGTLRAAGWEVLNAVPSPAVDHLGNAKDLTRFPDMTFAVLYASHVLEHFDYKQALSQALREWYRVLQPGGSLYVSVPDLEVLCGLYLDKGRLSEAERFHVMRMMFGGHVERHDYHLVGFNLATLHHFLKSAGFAAIQRVERFGLFADTSDMRFKNVPISLNVHALRPDPSASGRSPQRMPSLA